jgi:hypothetical protein
MWALGLRDLINESVNCPPQARWYAPLKARCERVDS